MMPDFLLKELSLDRVLRRLAEEIPDRVLISYPTRTLDFKHFTAADLDRLTRAVLAVLPARLRVPMDDTRPGERPVVAVVGISDLEYHLYFLALQRVGWRTLLMSPRLADQGFAHLLRQTGCGTVVTSEASAEAMRRVRDAEAFELDIVPMADIQTLEEVSRGGGEGEREGGAPPPPGGDANPLLSPSPLPPPLPLPSFPAPADPKSPADSPQLIIHSSGTTGLPKPVPLNVGEWLLQNAELVERIPHRDTLTTLPVFHSFGVGTLFRMLVGGRRLSVMSAERPVTASGLLAALDLTRSGTLVTVPHVLKFCAEIRGGAARLAQLGSVVLAGSAVPQRLGDDLVARGVTISTIYGQTESGGLMQPGSGRDWCWVSPLPHAEPFMKFEPVEEGGDGSLCHLVILPGLPTKTLSNRDDGSYGTNDLFERHPTDPRKWKFAGRADDIIVLVNGEKADPTPLEQALSHNANVHAAVVFGAGYDSLGVLVVPSESAFGLSTAELLDSIKPDLELGNAKVPAYARVSPDSVIFKDASFQVPMTAKSTLIRSKFLELCRGDIERFYTARDLGNEAHTPVADEDIELLVRKTIKSVLSIEKEKLTNDSDFFFLGMDSLQASHVRSRLLKRIGLVGSSLATNVVFECPTVNRLTKHILDVRHARDLASGSEILKPFAESLVKKYTQFPKIEPGTTATPATPATPAIPATASGQIVLLTGATGTIGCHVLHDMARQPGIDRIYCLVRADGDGAAELRVAKVLADKRLDDLDGSQLSKIIPLAATFGEPRFGLTNQTYEDLRSSVTTIIHGAWAVNFNMTLRSFEEPHISSVSHLLDLAMHSPQSPKPTFCFLSSVASALRAKDSPLRELQYEWETTSEMGYGQSKWVAEKICDAAAQHAKSCGVDFPVKILRIGQVAGDTRHGMWNPTETIPIIVQSGLTTGVLPITDGVHDTHFWLPVDFAAVSIVELVFKDTSGTPSAPGSAPVFHVSNTTPVRWGSDFLPALRRQGMVFETVPASDWLRRLERLNSEDEENPACRLLDWLKRKYEPAAGSESLDDNFEMDMTASMQYSSILKNGVQITDELVGKFLQYWTQLEEWEKLCVDNWQSVGRK